MTIRKKMITFFLALFVALTVIIVYYTQTIFLKGFKNVENKNVEESISNVKSLVNYDIDSLENLVEDWAEWDDTYQFVVNHNQEYVERNLAENAFNTQNIQMMLFCDLSGNLVYAKSFDTQNNKEVPIPDNMKEHIFYNSPLFKFDGITKINKGLILLPQGPLLVAAEPIVDSLGTAPARGILVVGRYLNELEVANLSKILQIPLSLYSIQDPKLPEDFKVAETILQQGKTIVVDPLNEDTITGYAMLSDLYGNSAIIFKIDKQRIIYQQGRQTIVYYLWALVVASLVIGTMLILLLEKSVLRRLAHLNKGIIAIRSSENISNRVTIAGEDELTNVAAAINKMLESMEKAQCDLLKSELRNRAIVEAIPDLLLWIDQEGLILDYKEARLMNDFMRLSPECIGQNIQKFLPVDLLKKYTRLFPGVLLDYNEKILEYKLNLEECIYYREARFISIEENKLLIIIRDISERRRMEHKLRYYSQHDVLTGLYNRTYFEEQLLAIAQEPLRKLSIIMCDIDGLKLINDTLGHDQGDILLINTTKVLKECCPEDAVIARIGGDEFVIIIRENDRGIVEVICKEIRAGLAQYNAHNTNPLLNLSFSLGIASNCNKNIDIAEMIKQADNAMYREKLHCKRSIRSSVVQTLKKTLEIRDFITEGHATRLSHLIRRFAVACGLPQDKINELELFAEFHDIGKVGIPDQILFKQGPLTSEERAVMQQHSEIGYRIAQVSPELEPISEWILKHHEWWCGQGYPLGIKEENIPIECRMLAILDAYDAMTNDRPYRKALSKREAIGELQHMAGVQFDPHLVRIFIEIVKDQNTNG